MSPVLETERLTLRVPDARDTNAYLAFMRSEDARMVGGPMSTQQAKVSWGTELAHWSMHGYGRFSVVPKGEDVSVGMVGPQHPMGWPENELNWYFFEAGRGKGYATESARAAIAWTYATLKWPSIISYILQTNTPSIRVAERLGAVVDKDAISPRKDVLTLRYPAPEVFQ